MFWLAQILIFLQYLCAALGALSAPRALVLLGDPKDPKQGGSPEQGSAHGALGFLQPEEGFGWQEGNAAFPSRAPEPGLALRGGMVFF